MLSTTQTTQDTEDTIQYSTGEPGPCCGTSRPLGGSTHCSVQHEADTDSGGSGWEGQDPGGVSAVWFLVSLLLQSTDKTTAIRGE